MTDKLIDEITIALDAANGKREWPMFCTPLQNNIKQIAARAAQAEQERDTLQTDNDIAMKIINMIRNLVGAGETELVTNAVKRILSERDELRRQLEQAQLTISQAKATIENLTAPRDDYPYEGDEMYALQREAAGL